MLQGTTGSNNRQVPKGQMLMHLLVFVDLEEAFDSVNRVALWHRMRKKHKLRHSRCIIRRYKNTKFCVKLSDRTNFSRKGVWGGRQGWSLSPHFFDIFTDDILDCYKKETDTPY